MESENTWKPTKPLEISENNKDQQGSTFKIYFTFNVQSSMTFNLEELKRHIIRAYHDNTKNVYFTFISDSGENKFKPNDYCPYIENVSEKTKYIYFKGDKDEAFVVSEEEKDNPYAIVKSYILKETITKNPYLGREGNKVPGIDFYRNNRLCNTRYPISKIGEVGGRLQKGQMRGKRCHMTVHFTDKKVSETKSFDDCIGVTTVKDIYEEDDRMEPSLINILENVAGECACDYEDYTNKQKDGINDYMEDIQKYVKSLYNDEIYLKDILLDRYAVEMDNFTTHKLYYYDDNDDKIKFAKNKLEVKERKKNGDKTHKSNSKIMITAYGVLQEIKKAQKIKKQVIIKKNRIQEIMVEKDLDEPQARLIYNQEKENEKLMKQAEDIENKKKEEERIKKEKEKREKEEKEELELAKQKEKEKLELEEKINKLNEDVMKLNIDQLRLYWVEQHKNSIISGN